MMEFAALVVLAALVQYFLFALSVAGLRENLCIPPPAMQGHEQLERAIAVHRNTGELLLVFISLMLICGHFWMGSSRRALASGGLSPDKSTVTYT